MELTRIIRDDFQRSRIMIVGDIVADQFLNGSISRVSREAPVFIMRHEETETMPGAAANAAANVASLGAAALLIGLTGDDPAGRSLTDELEGVGVDTSGIVSDRSYSTIRKVRVLAGQNYAPRQQVIRIDYESGTPISQAIADKISERIDACADQIDAIIISDYGYGVVTRELFQKCRAVAEGRNIPLVVDSRYHITEFTDATSATPNREELEQILGSEFTHSDCLRLCTSLNLKALLVTNGNKGMSVYESGTAPVDIDVFGSAEPVDVTGAGDTVIAAYTLGLSCGLSFVEAAKIANIAGGIVVMKKKTATVSADEILRSITEDLDAATANVD